MITFSSNLKVIVQGKLDAIRALKDNPDPILRAVALTVLPELRKRVHVNGLDSAGQKIGTYSPGYMVVRTGNYKNADKFSRGKNAGKNKNSGTFTKKTVQLYGYFDKNVVSDISSLKKPRPNYHRSDDTTVILSLTRQMENDLSVIDTPEGYGIGYLNPENFKKSQYCETIYGKKILSKLTDGEVELAQNTAQEFTADYIKNFS